MRVIFFAGLLTLALSSLSNQALAQNGSPHCKNIQSGISCTMATIPTDTGSLAWVQTYTYTDCVDEYGNPGIDINWVFGSYSYTSPSGSVIPLSGSLKWTGPLTGAYQGGSCGAGNRLVSLSWSVPLGTLTFEFEENPEVIAATIN